MFPPIPTGADVDADGAFVGSHPASLKAGTRKHTITEKMPAYKDWSRDITPL